MNSRALRLNDFVSFLPKGSDRVDREWAWELPEIAGRLVELSGVGASATLTVAFGLVLDAQWRGEPAAWVTLTPSSFFPPDAAQGGVDLDSLAVVRAPHPQGAARSAEQLTRSGAFGLVVIDLGMKSSDPRHLTIAPPLQTRLVGLAQKHETAIVVLTEKPSHASSLGSLISLRAEVKRAEADRKQEGSHPLPALFEVELRVIKDKRRGPGRTHREVCHGPAGLR